MNLIEEEYKKKSCYEYFITILSIPLVILFSIILSYIGVLGLKIEIHTVVVITTIFIIFTFFIKHNANYTICEMKNSSNDMESSLREALKDNSLNIMGESKSTLNIHEYISDYYKDIRNDNFAQVATSIFPMLGILGTFIAIAISMPDFTVKDASSLDREITLLLSGIGTAFYASIFGIFLSIWWTYFEKRGVSKVDRYILELEKLYTQHIWKKSELIKHQHQQNELKEQEIIKTLKETFNLDFIRELNEQYMKNFKLITDSTTEAFTQLGYTLNNSSKDLRDTLDRIDKAQESIDAVDTIKNSIEDFTQTAKTLSKTLDKFDNSVDKTFVKIDNEIGDIVSRLGDFASIISEQNREIQESILLREKKQKYESSLNNV
ncbi:Arginine/ornithine antiporter ArcD [hydrothermal vent metagenome]|uniref:Arginine/ornithine antiporter ArcD n=1 Tax=hydrothermal vent metagenome TaxID=652676 RepID=A0A1W1EL18_9ZZZZ